MDKRKSKRLPETLRAEKYAFFEDIDIGNITLKDAVKRMRALSGLTQQEFAMHRGVSISVIKKLETGTGNPTIKSINTIAAIFGLEVGLRKKSQDEENE